MKLDELCVYLKIFIHIVLKKSMRTNIVIDDELMNMALKVTGLKTKKAVVEEGLRTLLIFRKQLLLTSLKGKLKWEGDIDKLRLDK